MAIKLLWQTQILNNNYKSIYKNEITNKNKTKEEVNCEPCSTFPLNLFYESITLTFH